MLQFGVYSVSMNREPQETKWSAPWCCLNLRPGQGKLSKVHSQDRNLRNIRIEEVKCINNYNSSNSNNNNNNNSSSNSSKEL